MSEAPPKHIGPSTLLVAILLVAAAVFLTIRAATKYREMAHPKAAGPSVMAPA